MILTATLPLLLAAATFTPTTTARLENAPGQLRFEAGVLSEPFTQKLEDAARTYVAGRVDLQLPAGSTLGTAKIFGTRFGASVHLPQLINNVPVDGASVVVTFDNQKRVVQVSSNLLPYKTFSTFSIAPQTALDTAGRGVQAGLIKSDGHFYGTWHQRYFVVGDEARAGYLVFVPTIFPNENWHAVVDAVTSEVLFKQNRIFFAQNDAQVYARNPGGLDAGVGVTPTIPVTLTNFRGDAGGTLTGSRIISYGCCTTEACDGGTAGPRTIAGTINVQGFNVSYDAGICERVQRASNDTAVNINGDFIYTPVDPPNPICTTAGCRARPGDLADEDQFAEVHAYHHVNAVYEFVRTISGNAGGIVGETIPVFDLRDVTGGKQTAVWSNITIPNQAELQANVNIFAQPPTTYSSTLAHFDNAAFVPREQAQSPGALLPPAYTFTTDAFMLFQGDRADYAYDAPVVWHEFGHGMLNTVPGLSFASVTFDSRSANNETGAIHEGMADWLAAAFGQNPRVGDYIGPRGPLAAGGTTLRSADNAFKCPDVLWGQVHQDSMHLTGSVWGARKELFQGTDQGRTYDAVVYAALASLPANAGFGDLANAIATRVQTGFPNVVNAEAKIRAIFDARGITNCSKILDITGEPAPQRDTFIIADRATAGLANGQYVPGPFQFKISLPNGARSVVLKVPPQRNQFTGAASAQPIRLLAKNAAITFNKTSTVVTHNATATGNGVLNSAMNATTATANLDIPCGGDVYLAITASTGTTLQDVSFTVDPKASCNGDAGTPDAGNNNPVADAGTDKNVRSIDEGGAGAGGTAAAGCGCNADGASLILLASFGVLAMARRRLGFRASMGPRASTTR